MVGNSRVNFRLGGPQYPINLNQSSIEVAMAFNIVVTALLLWRVSYLAPKVPTSFPDHIRRKFVRIDAVLVESVLLLGVISLVYVSLFGDGSTGANLFFPFIVQLEVGLTLCKVPVCMNSRSNLSRLYSPRSSLSVWFKDGAGMPESSIGLSQISTAPTLTASRTTPPATSSRRS